MAQLPEADQRLLATDLHVEATSRLMEALVESENRMRRRVELLSDAVVETDAAGCLVFANPAWQSLTGLAPAECLGRQVSDYFPEGSRAELRMVLADRSGDHQQLVTRIDNARNRTVHVMVTTSLIPSGGVVVVVRDITAETEYQEELGKLSVVASSTSNLVVITNTDGMIEWVNAAFEERTGYPLDEVMGRRPGAFLQGPGTDAAAVERIRTAIAQQEPVREELLNYTKTGTPYWISLNVTPVLSVHGRLERYISVQEDITDRKRVDRMKDEFISTVSHELRTPLTAINGALGLLSAGIAGTLPDQASRLVEIASKNGDRLTVLINDLLDMDKLVEGGLPIESEQHRLLPIVQRAIRDNQSYADRYLVTLMLDEPYVDAVVDVDSLRLTQVLANLLSNASKFAPPHTVVDVSIHTDGDVVRVAVHDQGPGVPESFREAIFEKFSQADASDSRAVGGSGLGLAISKELVERMRGTIGYHSTPGNGSTFFVDLPVCAGVLVD